MKKIKKYLILSIICLTLTGMFGYTKIVKADSGWDSSYDSGGSWDSGSDWGSSWDYGDSSSSSYYSTDGSFLGFIITMVLILALAYLVAKKRGVTVNQTSNSSTNRNINTMEISNEKLKEIDESIDKDEMNMKVFDIYKNVQNAWAEFDYDKLRDLLTDELFNMYKSQLKVLKAKKQKNIMEDIEFVKAKITDVSIENGIEKVKMYLNVTMKDYVVDANNNVVRGTNKNKINIEYLITLNRYVDSKDIKTCPSCGAPLDIVSGGKCPYCESDIINKNTEFVMSKKECIGQRRI